MQSWVVSRHGKGASRGWEHPRVSLALQTPHGSGSDGDSGSGSPTEGIRGSARVLHLPPAPAAHSAGGWMCPELWSFRVWSEALALNSHTHTRLELPWMLQTIPDLPKSCPGLEQRKERREIFPSQGKERRESGGKVS